MGRTRIKRSRIKTTTAVATSLALTAGLVVAAPAQADPTLDCPIVAFIPAGLTSCWGQADEHVRIILNSDFSSNTRLPTTGGKTRTIDLNGLKLTINGGIQLQSGDKLIVEDEVGGGELLVTGNGDNALGDAIIGGDSDVSDPTSVGESAGDLTINSGKVAVVSEKSEGVDNQAPAIGGGIGGGTGGDGGMVTVNGGTLTATGGLAGPGIGGGPGGRFGGRGGDLTVNGGSVEATGGDRAPGVGGGSVIGAGSVVDDREGGDGASVEVNGGTLSANGGASGAGIGGGYGQNVGGDGGSLTVNGGAVVAVGGAAETSIGGTGIGGGTGREVKPGSGASVAVKAGEVRAVGGEDPTLGTLSAPGIGTGVTDVGGSLTGVTPGPFSVWGKELQGSETDGGEGGSPATSKVATAAFKSDAIKGALITEIAGTPLSAGSAHIQFRAINPPTPPVGRKSQSLKPGATPKTIKRKGTTTINKRNAKTKQGLPVTAKMRIVMRRGEVRCATAIRGPQRLLKFRTYNRCNLSIRVIYTAPGNSQYKALRVVKKYKVKRR